MGYRLLALAVVLTLSACGSSSQTSSRSPSPAVTQPLIAVSDSSVDAHEIQLISLNGAVVAQAVADFAAPGSVPSAGGRHAVWVDRSSDNLWELTADGRTKEIATLPTVSYAGIASKVLFFAMSFDGKQWAWITEAQDWNHRWPANQYDPTVYSDVWIGGDGLTPKLVHHEVTDGYLVFYRWTAKGPIFYWHPYADMATPFPGPNSTVNLVDTASATIRPVMERLLDVGADGTMAYQGANASLIEFSRNGVTTKIDTTGFYDSDIQFRPGAATTTALVGLAEWSRQGVGAWPYRTGLVDVGSGRMLVQPIMNAAPAWRAWLPDGRVLLKGTGPRQGLFVYSPDGSMHTILDHPVNVFGVLTMA